MNSYLRLVFLFLFLYFFASINVSQELFYFRFSIIYTVLFFYFFLVGFNKNVPFFELLCVFIGVQLLLIPCLFDYLEIPLVHRLNVNDEDYYRMFIPTVISFTLGLFLPIADKSRMISFVINAIKHHGNLNSWSRLIVIGFLFNIMGYFLGSINTIGAVIRSSSNVLYIGAIFVLFTEKKYKYLIAILVILFSLITSISSGLFWGFIFWTLFIVMLYTTGRKILFIMKLVFFMGAVFILIALQNIKTNYRGITWAGDNYSVEEKIGLFSNMLLSNLETQNNLKEKSIYTSLIIRLNQAKLDSKVIYTIPKFRDYDYGTSIMDSFFGAFIPRALWPDKPGYDTRKLQKFGGYTLEGSTFMSISTFAEAFANFNLLGAIVFMFFYGVFLNLVHLLLLKIAIKIPTVFLFTPLIFFDVVRVEVDFTHVFSSLVTGIVSIFTIFLIFEKGLGVKIFRN